MVARPGYVPRYGDVVWVEFDPQVGKEQAGRRPALVLSRTDYNERSGLCLCCPITSRSKDYPLEVALPAGLDVRGVILADHVKSIDWRGRRTEFMCTAPGTVCRDVIYRVEGMFGGKG